VLKFYSSQKLNSKTEGSESEHERY